MTLYTYAEKSKIRKKYLLAYCSKTVVDFITMDNSLNEQTKIKALELAKKIARKEGRNRVYWRDFQIALRIVRDDNNVPR
ncbi:hypothetical protein DRN73_09875 [Candidatus Pacearchaeota archaeon]|nr:MAG: hypothetical protein DRN73_09875 [Candidatus Pacearchaeota archaeon]